MTSKLILYKNCKIIPQKNMKVDNISTYLAAFTDSNKQQYDNFQYQKIELDMFIKVPMAQSKQVNINEFNYCSIEQESKTYYFFILNADWISEAVLQLQISMDTVNSISHTFSNKTNIIRQHKSRFLSSDRLRLDSTNTLHQVVDKVDEGVTPALMIKDSDTRINDSDTKANTNWCLVYKTLLSSEENKSIDVFLMPKSNDVPIDDGYQAEVYVTGADLLSDTYYYFTYIDNPGSYYKSSGEVNPHPLGDGNIMIIHQYEDDPTKILYQIIRNGGDDVLFIISDGMYFLDNGNFMRIGTSTKYNDTYRIQQIISKYSIKSGQSGIRYLLGIDTVDRSDSKLVNIIELPYLPNNITWSGNTIDLTGSGWEIVGNKLHLINYTSEFERSIRTVTLPLNITIPLDDTAKIIKDKSRESKLKHSSLYNWKLTYDDNATGIAFERIQRTGNYNTGINIKFKPSNAITSDLIYHWTFNDAIYKEVQDYETYLSSTRNNQLGLYNSEYLNYMRTGFNYDTKAKNQNLTKNIVLTGVQIAGGIASIIFGQAVGKAAGVGLITSSITTITNMISQTVASEQQISQKISEYKNQATSISNVSSVDLFNYYNGNKLHNTIYTMSEQMQNQMFDLFHYCGYAVNEKGIPTTNSRMWFNYIQCEPVFESIAETDFINDLKARYKTGVTVYHSVEGEYDWEQQYENWENYLFS